LTNPLYFDKVLLMKEDKTAVWKNKATQQLTEVLISIDSEAAMQNFLRDVMTEKEIIEISSRLEAARMLQAGYKYTDITEKTKLSSRTVARISDWIQNGCGGYGSVLSTVTNHHGHLPPVRAE
jgi:TrpR-related protein YerC/YecD